jgi:hypothetical protein
MHSLLIIPAVVWVVAQLLKLTFNLDKDWRTNLRTLITSGGMPSAHVAFVSALTTAVALRDGLSSDLFAVTAAFAAIVSYDAMGVRFASGEQAKAINRLVERVLHGKRNEFDVLREELGHRPSEVAGGVLLGVLLALIIYPLL